MTTNIKRDHQSVKESSMTDEERLNIDLNRAMAGERVTQKYPSLERKPLTLTINGQKIGPIDVPVSMLMIDFLHEYLDLTGTHFGCGQGICHACTVVEIQADGTKTESRTCIFGAHYFAGKHIVTIEGQATEENGELILTPIQQAFIDNFSFQCGYCAPGFVAGATVFLDQLNRKPIQRANLERAIETALNEHICRCTGYVRYYEAIRDVALATPGCVIE